MRAFLRGFSSASLRRVCPTVFEGFADTADCTPKRHLQGECIRTPCGAARAHLFKSTDVLQMMTLAELKAVVATGSVLRDPCPVLEEALSDAKVHLLLASQPPDDAILPSGRLSMRKSLS